MSIELPNATEFFQKDTELATILSCLKSGELSKTSFHRHGGIMGDIGFALGWYPDEHKKNYSRIEQFTILGMLRKTVKNTPFSPSINITEIDEWFGEREDVVALSVAEELLGNVELAASDNIVRAHAAQIKLTKEKIQELLSDKTKSLHSFEKSVYVISENSGSDPYLELTKTIESEKRLLFAEYYRIPKLE